MQGVYEKVAISDQYLARLSQKRLKIDGHAVRRMSSIKSSFYPCNTAMVPGAYAKEPKTCKKCAKMANYSGLTGWKRLNIAGYALRICSVV